MSVLPSLQTPSLGPLLRDMPDIEPTLVLSLRAGWVVAAVRWEFRSAPPRSTRRNRATSSTSASSSPARLVTSARPRTMLHVGSLRSDGYLHQHQLRSHPGSWKNRPWCSGAQRQHCPRAIMQFFLDSGFVFAVPVSSSIALTIASVELCGIESRTTL